MFPLIVLDEMATVPELTKTPPPCIQKHETCEISSQAMGKFQVSAGTHPLKLTEASVAVAQA